jgi:hypothetical protein
LVKRSEELDLVVGVSRALCSYGQYGIGGILILDYCDSAHAIDMGSAAILPLVLCEGLQYDVDSQLLEHMLNRLKMTSQFLEGHSETVNRTFQVEIVLHQNG